MILKSEKIKKWSKIKDFLELEKSEIYICIQSKEREIKSQNELKNE
jgi:hypothetical protein